MHRQAQARADVAVDLHGLGWIAVLFAHEPAWLVRADRNHREIGRAETFTDVGEQRFVITGVADEIEVGVASLDKKSAPQAPVAASAEPVTPMLGWSNGDG